MTHDERAAGVAPPSPGRSGAGAGQFSRCNLFALPLRPTIAHDGDGPIEAVRVAAGDELAGGCRFVDYAELPPGSTIGVHQHPGDEEEYYLVLGGSGVMQLGDDRFAVSAGDLVRNRAGGRHGLTNTGTDALKLFIFAVTPGSGPAQ